MKNPIGIDHIGDPFILLHDDKYFLYATSYKQGFYVWESTDLQNWGNKKIAYEKGKRSFGYTDFWAPEVVYHNGKFIMHYSARDLKSNSLRIGVAVSLQPSGPFTDIYDKKPMFDFGYAAIDGNVLITSQKKPYLYYSRDCSENINEGRRESHIYGVEISDDLTCVIGEPKHLISPCQAWEYNEESTLWNEGPYVFEQRGRYYMMYSGNCYESKEYAVGYCISDDPLGTFIKAKENPILSYVEGKVSGPGHNCLFYDRKNQLLCAYHVHTNYDNPNGNRQLFIDKVRFDDDKLIVEGPTVQEDNCNDN